MKTVPLKQRSLPAPKRCSSPAISSSCGSSSSGRSLPSNSEVHTSPGHYTPDSSPEPEPKQQLGTPSLSSLFDESTRITAANAAIGSSIYRHVDCVKEFKPPSELDFSATTEEQPLALANSDKNRPFINQLCKLAGLQNELAAILTHGDKTLEDKVRKSEMPFRRALEWMQEHQLKSHEQFTAAFDHFLSILNDNVAPFEYPSTPDFVSNPEEDGMVLPNNNKNKPFISQLHKLDGLRTWLEAIPTHGDPELAAKCQAVSAVVGEASTQAVGKQLQSLPISFPRM
ncbi:hypothetical protein RSOL_377130, partial [Rhizoctonia solani AG-3 Rhs1AP]